MSEIYFEPIENNSLITLEDLQQRLNAMGLTCKLERDSADTCWIAFEPHQTCIFASTTAGNQVTLATVHLNFEDPPDVFETIEQVMTSIQYSAGEDADYE